MPFRVRSASRVSPSEFRATPTQIKKLQELRRSEDPRLSFSTPEFKGTNHYHPRLCICIFTTLNDSLRHNLYRIASAAVFLHADAQRAFTDAFKRNFGRPVEYGLVKQYPWSAPQLVKLSQPVRLSHSALVPSAAWRLVSHRRNHEFPLVP